MTGTIYDWSLTASDNQTADGDINWQENQLPDTVNGSARVMMKRQAEWLADVAGSLNTAGSSNAYTVTANSAFTSLIDGLRLTVTASFSNSGAATLNANSLGAKALRKQGVSTDVALVSGDIISGQICHLFYSTAANGSAGAWILLNPGVPAVSGANLASLNASNLSTGTVPDARFPATLPALSGANLTSLNASNLASGTVPSGRVSGAYTGITGVGTLTALGVTGTVTGARFVGTNTGSAASPTLATGGVATGLYGSTDIRFAISGSDVATLSSSGVLTIARLVGTNTGSAASPTLATGGVATGLYGSTDIRFAISGSDVATLSNSGALTTARFVGTNTGSASSPTLATGNTGTGLFGSTDLHFAVSGTDVATLNSSGVLTTSGYSTGTFSTSGASAGLQIANSSLQISRATAAQVTHIGLYNPNGLVATITTTGSGGAINSVSDGRLKVNRVALDDEIDVGAIFDKLEPEAFDMLSGNTGLPTGERRYGLIAQKVYEVAPWAVVPGSDVGPGEDGFLPWQFAPTEMITCLIAEVKSLRKRTASLEVAR